MYTYISQHVRDDWESWSAPVKHPWLESLSETFVALLLGFMPQVYCWRCELWGMLGYIVGHYIITDLTQQLKRKGGGGVQKRTHRSRVNVEIKWIIYMFRTVSVLLQLSGSLLLLRSLIATYKELGGKWKLQTFIYQLISADILVHIHI